MDLDEVVHVAPHLVAHYPVGRNGSGHGDDAIAGKEARDEADSPDVDVAVFFGERESLRDVLSHLVAVEQFDTMAARPQLLHDDLGDGALARAGEAGEPQTEAGRQRKRGAVVTGGRLREGVPG